MPPTKYHITAQKTVLAMLNAVQANQKDVFPDRRSHLVLCSISDQTLAVSETNVRRSGAVAHVVGDNFHAVILPDANATAQRTNVVRQHSQLSKRYARIAESADGPVCSTKINTDSV